MITFKLINKTEVIILFDGKEVGHIFSPAGTSQDKKDAIQICGFDEAYGLGGCGIYREIEKSHKRMMKEENINPKKDIQLLFNKKTEHRTILETWPSLSENWCFKCFHFKEKCRCNDLVVRKDYDKAKASQIAERL